MPSVLVLYYSSYGHIERMARAQAEGVARVPRRAWWSSGCLNWCRRRSARPRDSCWIRRRTVAVPDELGQYDAIIFGTPTRFGNMAAQMRNFLDQTGALWGQGALVGKVGSVFCSTASQHGGQETTITSFHSTLLHHGMIIVGLPYTFKDLATMREITGGTPYGASCVTGAGHEARMPTALELEMCRFQGEHVARISSRLVAGASAA